MYQAGKLYRSHAILRLVAARNTISTCERTISPRGDWDFDPRRVCFVIEFASELEDLLAETGTWIHICGSSVQAGHQRSRSQVLSIRGLGANTPKGRNSIPCQLHEYHNGLIGRVGWILIATRGGKNSHVGLRILE